MRVGSRGEPYHTDTQPATAEAPLRRAVPEPLPEPVLNPQRASPICIDQAVLNHLPDGVAILDSEGSISFANGAVAAILGTTLDEIIGKPSSDVLRKLTSLDTPPSGGLLPPFRHVLDQGATYEDELILATPGGVSVRITGLPLLNSAGEVSSALLLLQDITEKREPQCQLSQTDVLFQLSKVLNSTVNVPEILGLTLNAISGETITASIALLDSERRQLTVMNGDSSNTLERGGRTVGLDEIDEEARKIIFEEGKPYCSPTLTNLVERSCLHGDVKSFFGIPLVLEDQTIGVLALESTVPMEMRSDKFQLLCSIANLTAMAISKSELYQELTRRSNELKEQKSKFEALIEGIRDGLVIVGKDFRIAWQNRVTTELHGDTVGKLCYEAYKKRSEPCKDCPVVKVFDTGQVVNSAHSLCRKDGWEYSSEDMSVPVYGHDDNIVGVIEVYRDVSERKRIEREVLERTRELEATKEEMRKKALQLRELFARTIHIGEEERKRIAIDTHDGVLQLVISSLYEVQALQRHVSQDDSMSERLDAIRSRLDQAVVEMRRVIRNLRPPLLDRVGLVQCLRHYIADYQESSQIQCALESKSDSFRLSQDKELAIFRIVQEALENAKKHAMAHLVKVSLDFSPELLTVFVVDDGRGLKEQMADTNVEGHWGLLGMRERAQGIGATLTIESVSNGGTRVRLEVPVAEPPARRVGRGTKKWAPSEF